MPEHSQRTSRRRRQDGEGSVYQIRSGPKAGEWRAQISLVGGGRRGFSARTEDEVRRKLLDAMWESVHGRLAPVRGDNFEQFAAGWLHSRRHDIRPRTMDVYEQHLRDHINPVVGKLALIDIKRHHVQQVQLRMQDKGLKAKTIRLARHVLSSVLAEAEIQDLVVKNVATGKIVKLPKVQRVHFEPLTPDEVTTLIRALHGDPLEALVLLTLSCGLRRGEVCAVRWADLDLAGDQPSLLLAGQIAREKGKGLVYRPWQKSETGRGLAIGLAQPVVDALLAHRDRLAFVKAQAGELWDEQDYVFTNAIGDPMDPFQAVRLFKQVLERAGLRDQRFHDLRHCTASLFVAWGVDLALVSKLLRHAGLSITADVYSTLYAHTAHELAERMGSFIQQARLAERAN